MKFRVLAVLTVTVLACVGCGKQLDPPPAKLTVTQSIFTPVYRASKAIQGATGPGVTYVQFGQLLQDLSTEISIAKDQQMNEIDKRLIEKYEDALTAYKFSSTLWQHKIQATEDYWKGEIPVGFEGNVATEFADGLARYQVKHVERRMPYTGTRYFAVPGESIQFVWLAASAAVDGATEVYYGRSDGVPIESVK